METAGDLAQLLLDLRDEGHAGVLEIMGEEGLRTDLFIRNGQVIFAEQGSLGETLGRLLLREGVLEQDQYSQVINRMTERLVDSEQLRFGEAAIELGFVDAADIHEALALQVRRKAIRCFSSSRVDVTLRDDPEAIDRVSPFPTPITHVVLAGVREHYDDRRMNHVLFDVADLCPVVTAETRAFIEGMPLEPTEHRVLSKLPRDVTLLNVLRASSDPTLVKRLLMVLHLAHAIEFVAPTPGAAVARVRLVQAERAVRDAAPSEASGPGVSAGAGGGSEAEGQPGPEPPAREASVVTTYGIGARSMRSAMAVKIARAVGRSIPPPVSEKRARLEAAQAFDVGIREASRAKWAVARDAFRRAVRCMPGELEYGLHAAWAEVMASEDLATRKAKLQEAGVVSRQAMKQQPDLAYAHYVEGNVALEMGREELALRRFKHAASLDPNFTDAVRHARILQRRMEK